MNQQDAKEAHEAAKVFAAKFSKLMENMKTEIEAEMEGMSESEKEKIRKQFKEGGSECNKLQDELDERLNQLNETIRNL